MVWSRIRGIVSGIRGGIAGGGLRGGDSASRDGGRRGRGRGDRGTGVYLKFGMIFGAF